MSSVGAWDITYNQNKILGKMKIKSKVILFKTISSYFLFNRSK